MLVSLYPFKGRAAWSRSRMVKMGRFGGRAGTFRGSNNRLGVAVPDMVKGDKCGAAAGVLCAPV